MARVVACGLATVDVVQVVDHVPAPDEKLVALSTTVEAGGPALNAAVTASLLGVPATLVTAVGRGPFTTVVLGDLGTHGVALVDVAAPNHALPVSTVLVTDRSGERAVVSRNAAGVTGYAAADERHLDDAGVLLVDGHHLPVAATLARAARRRGIPVVLDAGSWKPGLERLLEHVDLVVASADLRTPRGEDPLGELLSLGPTFAARTAGPGPVTWRRASGGSGTVHPERAEVVDTLGAGDVLHGALAAHLARAGADDPVAALTEAVAVATESVRHAGARGWARQHG